MPYIHAQDPRIDEFIQTYLQDKSTVKAIAESIFHWFDKQVTYSRLNAPFYPLQRSDLDVLSMLCGTCGDFSNLLVSLFQRLGYEVSYAYVHKDCYGNEQDHICAAVYESDAWILLDATQPYRKWHGYHCPHQEYELLSPTAFEERMKKEESYWQNVAQQYGNTLYAGLLYAPWIHEEIISQSDTLMESVFYLLSMNNQKEIKIYAYYMQYTKDTGSIPMMSILSENTWKYCFSCKKPHTIWDNEQWSREYLEQDIPPSRKTDMWYTFSSRIKTDILRINKSLSALQLPSVFP